MLRYLFCIQLVLLFLLQPCISQSVKYSVKGKIADSLSKAGLEYANIIINEINETRTKKEIVAKKDGEFSFILSPGKYNITVTHTGYKKFETLIIVENNNIALPVYLLHTDITNLKTVTVETKKPFITLSAGKINLNIAESAVAAGNTAWDVLQIAPGVIAADNGSVSLNGKSVTVYIDGRPSYLSGEQLKNLLSTMQSGAIDKIELISNPSARYDAAGQAIINIKTKKINKKGFNGTYTAGAGASKFFRYNTGIDFNYGKNKINFYGSYDFAHNKNNYTPLNRRTSFSGGNLFFVTESENDFRNRDNHNYRAGFDYSPGKNSVIGVLFKAYHNNRGRQVGGLTKLGPQKELTDSLIRTITAGDAAFSSSSVNLFYKTSFDSAKKELTINADYYNYNQQWADSFAVNFSDKTGMAYKPDEMRRDNSPTLLDIYAIAADYTQQYKKWKLDAGIKSSFIKTDNDVRWEINTTGGWVNDALRSNHFVYKENIQAAYAGISTNIKKWEIEAILRAEQTQTTGRSVTLNSVFKRSYLNLFPSLSLLNKPDKKNELTLSYRKSIRRPYYGYVNPFLIYQGQYSYFQGNPDMKPSYSHSAEFIHAYNSVLFTTLSYTYIKGFIGLFYRQDDATKIITRYYDNYTNVQTWSVNVTFSKNIKPWWLNSTYGTLSWSTAKYPGVVPGNSTLQPYIGTYNSFTVKKAALKFEVSGSYTAAYRDGFYHYKPFGVLNIGLQKEVLKKKGNLRLTLRDVFKTANFKYTAHYNNIDVTTTSASDSRVIKLNFTYRFGKQFTNRNKNRKSSIENETNRIN